MGDGAGLARRQAQQGGRRGKCERLAQIQKTLPEGVEIEIFYDRNDLIEKAVWTVQKRAAARRSCWSSCC